MSGRKNLPGLMEEAFGRVSIPEPRARAKVVRMPTEPNSAPSDTVKKMLAELRLGGMAAAYDKQTAKPESVALSFEMRLKHMLECEAKLRARRRFKTRLRQAGLRLPATVEMIDYDYARGWTAGRYKSWPPVTGSSNTRTSSSVGRWARARPSWPAPWPTRPASWDTRPFIGACPTSCGSWPRPGARTAGKRPGPFCKKGPADH